MRQHPDLDGYLASIPRLDGALCRGRSDLFDREHRTDPQTNEALQLCRRCPALLDCRDWLAGLPVEQRPHGVVAAQFRPPPPDLPDKPYRKPERPTRYRSTSPQLQAACDWLASHLEHGPTEITLTCHRAKQHGIKRGLLYKARDHLGVITNGRSGEKTWELPKRPPIASLDDETTPA